jgi:GT2 family glycosyltransferase
MKLSVVIPTHHRSERIGACLGALAPGFQTLGADAYEVIVTDDGDDEKTREVVRERFPWARWTRSIRKGPAPNRNHGARAASGDWLVFVDDDCVASPRLLEYIHDLAGGGKCDVVEGRIACPDRRDHPLYLCPDNAGGGVFWTANLSIEAAAFRRLGGFDEDLAFNAEDMELGSRIRRAGLRVVFSEGARVDHPSQRLSAREYLRRLFAYRALYLYGLKVGGGPDLRSGPGTVAWYVVSSHLLRQARLCKQVITGRHSNSWRAKAAMVAAHVVLMPVMIPYLVWWEFRFRRMLRQKST